MDKIGEKGQSTHVSLHMTKVVSLRTIHFVYYSYGIASLSIQIPRLHSHSRRGELVGETNIPVQELWLKNGRGASPVIV